MRQPDVQLDRRALAVYCGYSSVSTVDTYRRRGTLPPEDGLIGASPWWWQKTIDAWLLTRPKRGYNAPAQSRESDAAPPAQTAS